MHPSLRNVVVSGLFVHGAMLFFGFGTDAKRSQSDLVATQCHG